MTSNGAVIYDGPSQIDQTAIVCVLTGLTRASGNLATGNLFQTFILIRDVHPWQGVETGLDRSICGWCPARGSWCYVNVAHSVVQVWKTFRNGGYIDATGPGPQREKVESLIRHRRGRLGAYGDPAAIPIEVTDWLASVADDLTGYSHLWKDPRFQAYRKYCMASVDRPEELAEAWAKGWRTFRSRLAWEPVLPGEIECPKSDLAGNRLDCARCMACNGNDRPASAKPAFSVSTPIHGMKFKLDKFEEYRRGLISLDVT